MAHRSFPRRALLRGAAASGALFAASRISQAAPRVAANDRIGFGLIGCGSLGLDHHLSNIVTRPDFDVRAVCDPDAEHLARGVTISGGRAAAYHDFRELLDRADIDAVMVVTPDHWHALAAIAACAAGKDVYCEKPLSLTIAEGRAMVDAARRHGRVFQTGSQQRSSYNFRWACDLVRNGRIGTLKQVTACVGGGPTCTWEPDCEPPAHLDWNLWLGPAPLVPYTPKRCHYTFRWFYDYSGGKLTDWGAHHLDIAQWGIGAEHSGPVEVEAIGELPAAGLYETAVRFDVHYRYANGVTLHCTSEGENGVTFAGSEGTIFVSRSRIAAEPREILDQPADIGAVKLYRSDDHRGDWIACMRDRRRPICDVEIGHRSATVCHLGNIALRLRRKLAWDPAAERFVGDDEANRLLSKPMRAPWSLS